MAQESNIQVNDGSVTRDANGQATRTAQVTDGDAKEDFTGTESFTLITMLAIGVVTWRIVDMCLEKLTLDIKIAGAAGAAFIIGEVYAIFGYDDEREKKLDIVIGDDSDVNNKQLEALEAQRDTYQDIYDTAQTKLYLQAATAVGFTAAAGVAAYAWSELDQAMQDCQKATLPLKVSANLIIYAPFTVSDVSAPDEKVIEGGPEGVLKIINLPNQDRIRDMDGVPIEQTQTSDDSIDSAKENESITDVTDDITKPCVTPYYKVSQLINYYENEIKDTSFKTFNKVQTYSKEIGLSLAKCEAGLATALGSATAGAGAEQVIVIEKAQTELVTATPICQTLMTMIEESSALCSPEETEEEGNQREAQEAKDAQKAKEAEQAQTTKETKHESKLEEKSAPKIETPLESDISNAIQNFNSSPPPTVPPSTSIPLDNILENVNLDGIQLIDRAPTPRMQKQIRNDLSYHQQQPINQGPAQFLDQLLKNARLEAPKESIDYDPEIFFNSFMGHIMDLVATQVQAFNIGLMNGLGLTGAVAGAVAGLSTDMAFEYDRFLATPGSRAIIWTGLASLVGGAITETNTVMNKAEANVEKLDKIIDRMKRLENGIAFLNDGSASKLNATVTPVDQRIATAKTSGNKDSIVTNQSLPCSARLSNGQCASLQQAIESDQNFPTLGINGGAIGSNLGKIADSATKGLVQGSTLDLATQVAQGKNAVDSQFRRNVDKLNQSRINAGKRPIDLKKRGNALFDGLRAESARRLRSSGIRGSSLNKAFGNNAKSLNSGQAAKDALSGKNTLRRLKKGPLKYSGGRGKSRGRKRFRGVGISSQGQSQLASNADKVKALEKFKDIGDIVENEHAIIFEVISSRYLKSAYPRLFNDL